VSSAFDFLTFGALRTVFQALPETFRTAWFVESLLTELVVALVMRTRRPFYQSRPGRVLLLSTVALTAVTFAIPFLPFASFVGFVPLSPTLVAAIVIIVFAYVAATELAKRAFYRGRE
jgi:Mg2+-importing ATPase